MMVTARQIESKWLLKPCIRSGQLKRMTLGLNKQALYNRLPNGHYDGDVLAGQPTEILRQVTRKYYGRSLSQFYLT